MAEDRELVVLVDKRGRDLFNHDGTLATANKIEAHRRGILHRAASVFIFDDEGNLLLQKRAANKYHTPNLWSNTCCTHPFPRELPSRTARRRLTEEMGLQASLTEVFTFIYKVEVGLNLFENEYDHVFFGFSNKDPDPDPLEVSDWAWMSMDALEDELVRNAGDYTPWLHKCFNDVINARRSGKAWRGITGK